MQAPAPSLPKEVGRIRAEKINSILVKVSLLYISFQFFYLLLLNYLEKTLFFGLLLARQPQVFER